MSDFSLQQLEAIIADRIQQGGETSWTATLAGKGLNKVAEKFGEEAIETVIAAIAQDRDALIGESADVLFHLLVLLNMKGITVDDVMAELASRTRQSGLAEKASRQVAVPS